LFKEPFDVELNSYLIRRVWGGPKRNQSRWNCRYRQSLGEMGMGFADGDFT